MREYHIFDAIQTAKVTVTLKGSSVAVSPSKNVNHELASFIRQNKSELVAMIERGRDLAPCEHCRGPQIAVRTADGYENFECQQCKVCSGCQKVVAI